MLHLKKHNSFPKTNTDKYYIILDYLKTFIHLKGLYTKEERTIIRPIIQEEVQERDFVAKIGTSAMICNDYFISHKLNSQVSGFIQYDSIIKIDERQNILIMPYYPKGSMRDYEWNQNNVKLFKSLLKQLFYSLLIAFQTFGFIHSNIHLGNVLMVETEHLVIEYDDIDIPLHGYKIAITDFEYSINELTIRHTLLFYREIAHILEDIIYNLRLEFDGMSSLHKEVIDNCYVDTDISDFIDIINSVDHLRLKPNKYSVCFV
jgi:hypothetical protein